MPKVSIIVPVYNKAKYIRDCLDSLVNQTLKDIEIICVDDKSTDNCLEILEEYAKQDNRIKLLPQKENRGLSASRNVGLKEATGEFVAFVDADDFVDLDFYEKLYSNSNGFDVVKGEIWNFDKETNRCVLSDISSANEQIKNSSNPIYFFYGITSAIYKNSLIKENNLSFYEDLFYNEDTIFVVQLVTKIDKIKVIDGVKYFYRYVTDSQSRDFKEIRIKGFYLSAIRTIEYLKTISVSKENLGIIFNNLFILLSFFLNSGMLAYKEMAHIKKEYLSLIKSKEINNEDKENEIKVSVIVPIYNGEIYLRKTLSCLTLQSLYEIEIICVNDCSTDKSAEIINEYAQDDKRIKVINCPVNGGESKARNIGLKEAKGEFIAFMDQDDKIDLLFYEKLYLAAKKNGTLIAKGNAIEIDYESKLHLNKVFPVKKNPLYFCTDWWTAIYKRSLIVDNHLQLPEGYPLGGDLKFLFDAVSKVDNISYVWDIYYYHLNHTDSGDGGMTSPAKIRSTIEIFNYILDNLISLDVLNKDKDLYLLYFNSYITHMAFRLLKATTEESKLLSIDFIFSTYDRCELKDELISKISLTRPLLAKSLQNNDKQFYKEVSIKNEIAPYFFEKEEHKEARNLPSTLIVPFINKNQVNKYILSNPFIQNESKLTLKLIDNRTENKAIAKLYNEFLESYNFENETWFIFAHSDFEFLSFPSDVLAKLDKNVIYGPVGGKAYFDKYKVGYAHKGLVYEKDINNNLHNNFTYEYNDLSVDTLDCMCLIVHSSLINKYKLRFDENFNFDLYVEDLCINCYLQHQINIQASVFNCAHHSSYVLERKYRKSYLEQLSYLNSKYPTSLFGGSVSPLGGKVMPTMSNSEFSIYKIRYEIRNKKKF